MSSRQNMGLVDHEKCAGNRRKEMGAVKEVKGVAWQDGVISNAKWRGVRISDVLNHAGVRRRESQHVCFSSHATLCQDDTFYGASVPIDRALSRDADILLAFEVGPRSRYHHIYRC